MTLLENLCWNFKVSDFDQLSESKVFEFLSKGDGTDLCWVRYNLGKYEQHKSVCEGLVMSETNIGRILQQTSEYLQNQVLNSLL